MSVIMAIISDNLIHDTAAVYDCPKTIGDYFKTSQNPQNNLLVQRQCSAALKKQI